VISINFPRFRDSTGDEVILELKKDEESIVEAWELEIVGELCDKYRAEAKNPCPKDKTFKEFREEFIKVNENVYKKTIKEGVGDGIDLDHSHVTYNYSMFIESAEDPFDSSDLKQSPGTVCVEKGIEPNPGCFLALSTMKKKEVAVFWLSSDVMFGKLGCKPRVPPEADILFQAQIVNVKEPKVKDEENVFAKLIKKAAKGNAIGREQFKLCNFKECVDIYGKWIHKLESARLENDLEQAKQQNLLKKMYYNISVCYLKMQKPEKTCIMIRELERLTSIRSNPKALYVKGKANLMLGNFEYAEMNLKLAQQLSPESAGIARVNMELERQMRLRVSQETEADDLAEKFQYEAMLDDEIELQEEENDREAFHFDFQQFKGKLEKLIIDFKSDQAIKFYSLTEELNKPQHIELAENLCLKHQIQLKGMEKANGEILFYVHKL
jgi:FK506-binding protein 6